MKSIGDKGQSVVEAVLLLFTFVVIATLVSGQIKENEIAAKIIQGPWKSLDNMIKHGYWTDDVNEAIKQNPNQNERHGSPKE